MQKLHEENEKLFDRLTEKSGLGSAPQVAPKVFFILFCCALCYELVPFQLFVVLWDCLPACGKDQRSMSHFAVSTIFVGHLVATFTVNYGKQQKFN